MQVEFFFNCKMVRTAATIDYSWRLQSPNKYNHPLCRSKGSF